MECLGYLLLKLTIFMIPQCISILKTFLRHFFQNYGDKLQFKQKNQKKNHFMRNITHYLLCYYTIFSYSHTVKPNLLGI